MSTPSRASSLASLTQSSPPRRALSLPIPIPQHSAVKIASAKRAFAFSAAINSPAKRQLSSSSSQISSRSSAFAAPSLAADECTAQNLHTRTSESVTIAADEVCESPKLTREGGDETQSAIVSVEADMHADQIDTRHHSHATSDS